MNVNDAISINVGYVTHQEQDSNYHEVRESPLDLSLIGNNW